MIFYFTGTGNSLYAAKALQLPEERLIDVAEACRKEEYRFSLEEGERVGFVFPTYCYTLGDLIVDFLERLELKATGYVFAVVTCGAGIGGTGKYLKSLLAKRGIRLSYLSPLVMPDNAIFYLNTPKEEEAKEILAKTETRLEEIRREIQGARETRIGKPWGAALCRGVYHLCTGTKPFRVETTCVGCGVCAKNCPSAAIEMRDGRPVWIKERCMKCAACINRCPVRAIQHGNKTEKRARYVHPILRSGK